MTTMQASERSPGSWPVRRRLPVALATWLVGTALAAQAAAQNPQWAIYVMRTDGSQVRQLVRIDGCRAHSSPRWSHDGTRVAFNATMSGWRDNALYSVNADGSGLRKLGQHVRPDWSPDDKQIVFDYYPPGGSSDVYVQDLLGQGRTKITAGSGPRWSPDGSLLAVSDRSNVFLMDLVTGEARSLFENAHFNVFNGFCWSPDGSRLAVIAQPSEGQPRELLLVDAGGQSQGIRKRIEGEMGGYVSFSPDGKQLAYSDAWKIRIVEVDGTSRSRLLPGQEGRNRHPDWSPDGKWIVFASDRETPNK